MQRLNGFNNPIARLEQYATPAKVAADILYTAHSYNDIQEKVIVDLGCGTGIFTIGAWLLGASEAIGIDIDKEAIITAQANANMAECNVEFQSVPVEEVDGKFDICIMNPPFGSQTKHADLPFLDKALEIAKVVYSLHNSETLPFLRKRIKDAGFVLDLEKNYKFKIPHTFEFHRKEKMEIDVTLLRIVKND